MRIEVLRLKAVDEVGTMSRMACKQYSAFVGSSAGCSFVSKTGKSSCFLQLVEPVDKLLENS